MQHIQWAYIVPFQQVHGSQTGRNRFQGKIKVKNGNSGLHFPSHSCQPYLIKQGLKDLLYLTTLRLNIFQGKREIATFPTIFCRVILFSGQMALFQSKIGYYLVIGGNNQDKILLNKVTAKTDKPRHVAKHAAYHVDQHVVGSRGRYKSCCRQNHPLISKDQRLK